MSIFLKASLWVLSGESQPVRGFQLKLLGLADGRCPVARQREPTRLRVLMEWRQPRGAQLAHSRWQPQARSGRLQLSPLARAVAPEGCFPQGAPDIQASILEGIGQIQSSDDLAMGSWTNVPDGSLIAGAAQLVASQDVALNPTDNKRFFRVMLSP